MYWSFQYITNSSTSVARTCTYMRECELQAMLADKQITLKECYFHCTENSIASYLCMYFYGSKQQFSLHS